MNLDVLQLTVSGQRAVRDRNWSSARAIADEILLRDKNCAEAYFLRGLVQKAAGNASAAIDEFSTALCLDRSRHDAAIELALQYVNSVRYPDALKLLRRYEPFLANSPRYLDMAAGVYARAGKYASAWPLYIQANALQPGIDIFDVHRAECAVALGYIDEAKDIYRSLLSRNPTHQRNHYEYSRLATATDTQHLDQMLSVLQATDAPPERNIFLYYAIGKELEDLERWEEAFDYYQQGGSAAASVANYDVNDDVRLIDAIIDVCDADWLGAQQPPRPTPRTNETPIFIVGLPRTGTTLVDRILASHSQVESIGETFFMPLEIWGARGVRDRGYMDPARLGQMAAKDMRGIAANYLERVQHRLRGSRLFIDKLPENVLYLGFILRVFPDARIVCIERHPMDACFAMYKQSYFRFAYTLDDLGQYYIAHNRLTEHWKRLAADRITFVSYEELVTHQEQQTRALLANLTLPFEERCLQFHSNRSSINTASSVAVREPMHARSVGRWLKFSTQLAPLQSALQNAGIDTGAVYDTARQHETCA